MSMPLRASALREAYVAGSLSPLDVVEEVFRRIDARGEDFVWTFLADRDVVRERAFELGRHPQRIVQMPLYGLPFGVKDNVHVKGAPTTCGCPGFARTPTQSAHAVQRAVDAGAIFIGKQSLDQFATGLNGTRTLGGHCANTIDPALIPGGSRRPSNSWGCAVQQALGPTPPGAPALLWCRCVETTDQTSAATPRSRPGCGLEATDAPHAASTASAAASQTAWQSPG